MQSIDISSTTSDNSDHRHGALRRYTFVLVYGSFSRCFNWAWKNHSNEGGSSPLRGLGGSRKPARHRAFICLYCITAVDTMWPATALSRAFPVVIGLYTLTCEPNRMSFSPEVASFPEPYHSNNKSNECRLQPEPQHPFEALSIKKPFLLPLCHFLCGENVSFPLYYL